MNDSGKLSMVVFAALALLFVLLMAACDCRAECVNGVCPLKAPVQFVAAALPGERSVLIRPHEEPAPRTTKQPPCEARYKCCETLHRGRCFARRLIRRAHK